MTQAHPKDRRLPFHYSTHLGDGFSTCLRVARAIGNQHAVEFLIQKIVIPGNPDHGRSSGEQATDDAIFAAAVDYHDPRFSPRVDHGTVHADQVYHVIAIGVMKLHVVSSNHNFSQHAALLSQAPGERSGIYPPQGRDLLF